MQTYNSAERQADPSKGISEVGYFILEENGDHFAHPDTYFSPMKSVKFGLDFRPQSHLSHLRFEMESIFFVVKSKTNLLSADDTDIRISERTKSADIIQESRCYFSITVCTANSKLRFVTK